MNWCWMSSINSIMGSLCSREGLLWLRDQIRMADVFFPEISFWERIFDGIILMPDILGCFLYSLFQTSIANSELFRTCALLRSTPSTRVCHNLNVDPLWKGGRWFMCQPKFASLQVVFRKIVLSEFHLHSMSQCLNWKLLGMDVNCCVRDGTLYTGWCLVRNKLSLPVQLSHKKSQLPVKWNYSTWRFFLEPGHIVFLPAKYTWDATMFTTWMDLLRLSQIEGLVRVVPRL